MKSSLFVRIMLCIIILSLTTACTSSKINLAKADVAIINKGKYDSYISLYDQSGKFINKTRLNCPDVNTGRTHPYKYNDIVYMAANGYHPFPKTSKVVTLNLNSGKVSTPKVCSFSSGVAANDNYIFSVANNKDSEITRYNIKTNKRDASFQIEGTGTLLAIYDGKLYNFSDIANGNGRPYQSKISIIDPDTCQIEKTITVPGLGGASDSIYVNQTVYFTCGAEYTDAYLEDSMAPQPHPGKVAFFNPDDTKASVIDTGIDCVSQIKQYKNSLLVSHCYTRFEPLESNYISMIDIDTHEVKNIPVDDEFDEIDVRGDKLYALNKRKDTDDNNRKMYIYSLPDFSLEQSYDIQKVGDYFCSTFVLLKK